MSDGESGDPMFMTKEELEAENAKLRAINVELLAALQRTEAALLEGAEQYVIPVIREAIAKAAGRG